MGQGFPTTKGAKFGRLGRLLSCCFSLWDFFLREISRENEIILKVERAKKMVGKLL